MVTKSEAELVNGVDKMSLREEAQSSQLEKNASKFQLAPLQSKERIAKDMTEVRFWSHSESRVTYLIFLTKY